VHRVLVHPFDICIYHVIQFAMDSRQRHIGKFVARLGQKKPTNTGARPNSTSEVIIVDGSDDSDSQEVSRVHPLLLMFQLYVQKNISRAKRKYSWCHRLVLLHTNQQNNQVKKWLMVVLHIVAIS